MSAPAPANGFAHEPTRLCEATPPPPRTERPARLAPDSPFLVGTPPSSPGEGPAQPLCVTGVEPHSGASGGGVEVRRGRRGRPSQSRASRCSTPSRCYTRRIRTAIGCPVGALTAHVRDLTGVDQWLVERGALVRSKQATSLKHVLSVRTPSHIGSMGGGVVAVRSKAAARSGDGHDRTGTLATAVGHPAPSLAEPVVPLVPASPGPPLTPSSRTPADACGARSAPVLPGWRQPARQAPTRLAPRRTLLACISRPAKVFHSALRRSTAQL